jgi:thioredoxin 2
MVSPALERLAGELAGRIKLVKVDVDENPQVSQRFAVQAVPTLIVQSSGGVLARQPGAMPLTALREWVLKALPPVAGPPSKPEGAS